MRITKKLIGAGISALTAAALLAGCMSGGADAAKPAGTQAASPVQTAQSVTTAAIVEADAPQSGTAFAFSDGGVTVSGTQSGYEIDGTRLTVTASGVYMLTGSCADGGVTVKKGVTDVTLILDGLDLASCSGAPVCCGKESSVTLWLDGSSSLTDAEDPADENSADAAVADAFEGAAVKVKAGASLTITGSGALAVNGSAKNGVKSSDGASVTIAGGTLTITAVNDAVNAGGDLTVTGGALVIEAGDDALHADGVLTVGAEGASDGPVIDVRACCEGFEGAQVVLNAGHGSVVASDDGVNASSDNSDNEVSIVVNGGTWYVNADGDGLDAGGENNRGSGVIVLNGGTVTVFGSANDGNGALDSESGVTYNGGVLLAVGMSGMAEAPRSGVSVVFGGAGMGVPTGQPPQDGRFPHSGQQPPQRSDAQNGQSPQDGQFPHSGQQPPQRPDAQNGQSPQGGQFSRNAQQSSFTIEAGSAVAITDASGNVVFEAQGVKHANSVVFACESLVEGETYTLSVNGEAVAVSVAGAQSSGGFGGLGGDMPFSPTDAQAPNT